MGFKFMLHLFFLCLLFFSSSSSSSSLSSSSSSSVKVQGIGQELREAGSKTLTINVGQRGTAQFKSISEALHSIPLPSTRRIIISIGPGVYREKVVIPKSLAFITLLGNGRVETTISWNDSYSTIGTDGKQLRTFNSATVAVDSDFFIAVNIKFENTASYFKSKVEQAVALRISGNKAAFYNCSFFGVQDTLYDHQGLHYFKDCYIQGSVDFVFGDGRSLYEGCTLNSIAKDVTSISAQKRSESSSKTGFSFLKCNVRGSGQVYLGRPWGAYSRVVYSYTYMDKIVLPKGWNDTMDSQNHSLTVYYGEYKCSGPGSNFAERAPWVHRLTDKEAQQFIGIHFIEGDTWIISPN